MSMLRRLFSFHDELVEEPTAQAHEDFGRRLLILRRARQPKLLRLERAHAQAQAALNRTIESLKALQASRSSMLQNTAPPSGDCELENLRSHRASLIRMEEGLQVLCWQTLLAIRQHHAEVSVLSSKGARGARLQSLLDRFRCVYQASATLPELKPLLRATRSHHPPSRPLAFALYRTHNCLCTRRSPRCRNSSRRLCARRTRVKED
jgi:hypothetical protein